MRKLLLLLLLVPAAGFAEPLRVFASVAPIQTFVEKIGGEHVQVPIEREGKEPGARSLAVRIDQAKRERIKVVFVQPQFDKRSARQVAQAIGGVVVVVDPLDSDYIDNLRRVGRELARVLAP